MPVQCGHILYAAKDIASDDELKVSIPVHRFRFISRQQDKCCKFYATIGCLRFLLPLWDTVYYNQNEYVLLANLSIDIPTSLNTYLAEVILESQFRLLRTHRCTFKCIDQKERRFTFSAPASHSRNAPTSDFSATTLSQTNSCNVKLE